MNTTKVTIDQVDCWITTDRLRLMTEKGVEETQYWVGFFNLKESKGFLGEMVKDTNGPALAFNSETLAFEAAKKAATQKLKNTK